MASIFVAYVYEVGTGLFHRRVLTDDYSDSQAVKVAHCGPGEDALVVEHPGTLPDFQELLNVIAFDDEVAQSLVTDYSKIDPPPLVKYALVGPNGRIFDIVQTRRTNDVRLQRHADFERVNSVAAVDLAAAKDALAAVPNFELMDESLQPASAKEAYVLLGDAVAYGIEAETKTIAFDPVTMKVDLIADGTQTLGGFAVFAADAESGDVIEPGGTLRKRSPPAPVIVIAPEVPLDGELIL